MENYSCAACNAKFDSQQKLDGHVKAEHAEKAEPEQKEATAGTSDSREQ